MKNPKIEYEIRAGKRAPSELWSITEVKFGSPAENFVCEGTHTYCEKVKKTLENSQ